jgi:autotransporter translocation and assembly factor TamB
MLRWSLIVVLAAVVLLVVAAGVLLSPAGARLLVGYAETLLEPALEVEGVSGSLVGTLCVERFSYTHDQAVVTGRAVCVEANLWTSIDFLKVSLESLTTERLEIRTLSASGESSPSDPLSLPVEIEVRRLAIGFLGFDDIALTDLAASVNLRNDDLRSDTTLIYDEQPVRLTTSGPWRAARARLEALGAVAEVTADLLAAELPYQLEVRGERLALARYAGRPLELDNTVLSAQGDLQKYRFEFASGITDALGSGKLQATGTGDWSSVELDRLEIVDARLVDAPVGIDTLTARARIGWEEAFELSLQDLIARGALDGRPVSVRLAKLTMDDVAVEVARGEIRPFLPGTVASAIRVLRFEGRYVFAGTVLAQLEALGIPLELLDERVAGDLDATVTVRGGIDDPILNGRYELSDLRYGEYTADRLAGTLAGTLRRAAVSFELSSELGDLTAAFSYALTDAGISVAMEEAELNVVDSPVGPLQASLQDKLTVDVAEGAVRTTSTCFRLVTSDPATEPASLCGSVTYPEGPVSLELKAWPIPRLSVSGDQVWLTGEVEAALAMETLQPVTGRATMSLSGLQAHQEDRDTLSLGTIDGELSVADGRVVGEIRSLPDQGLALDGRVESTLTEPVAVSLIDGEVRLSLDGIWAAESLLPMDVAYELDGMQGIMTLHGEVKGTIGEPAIGARLRLEDGGWRVLALNTAFEAVELDAVLHDADRLTFTSQGGVGGGRLEISGELVDIRTDRPRLASEFQVTGARVVDLSDYSALVNGTLTLAMTTEALSVEGSVDVPSAAIRIAGLPEAAVTVSSDVVLVGGDTAAVPQQVRTSDVRLTLGDDVRLEAFGLKTRLVGNLRYREQPGRLPEVTGTIALREGIFEAYGQALTVERGQLTFTGPIDDPNVDVVATRVVNYNERDYRVSLLITGSALDLHTSVRSTPSLPEDDALALLITGRTFSQISRGEQTNVYGAALSLGLMGAASITGNLTSGIGVEEIILDQDAAGNMEVGAGVRLNQNLYMRYTYGAFSRLGGVLLRYRLSNRISAQATTGDAHSIEIRYGVDD